MKRDNKIKLFIMIVVIAIFVYLSIFGLTIKDNVIIKGAKNINTGLDISGGVSIAYEAKNEGKDITKDDLDKSKKIIEKRLNKVNIFDYFVRVDDTNDRIYLEIPADINDKEKDPLEAVKGLDRTAKVEFTDEQGNILLAGDDIKGAKMSEDPIDNRGIPTPHVVLEFSEEGSKKFAAATEKLVGATMVIKLDGDTIMAPHVNEKIDSNTAIITLGNGTYEEKRREAIETAMIIDSGSLPFSLEVINKEYIGPFIGQKALEISIYAGILAFILISLFLIIIYRLPGFIASISLLTYVSLVILFLTLTGTSITLPGIAGLILSIGMAVDANVIIFERLKEELNNNLSYSKAFERSFKNGMNVIIDGNVTTFTVAILLYLLGTGPVKGFGLILAVGVLLSVFTAVTITKNLLKQLVPLASNNKFLFGLKKEEK